MEKSPANPLRSQSGERFVRTIIGSVAVLAGAVVVFSFSALFIGFAPGLQGTEHTRAIIGRVLFDAVLTLFVVISFLAFNAARHQQPWVRWYLWMLSSAVVAWAIYAITRFDIIIIPFAGFGAFFLLMAASTYGQSRVRLNAGAPGQDRVKSSRWGSSVGKVLALHLLYLPIAVGVWFILSPLGAELGIGIALLVTYVLAGYLRSMKVLAVGLLFAVLIVPILTNLWMYKLRISHSLNAVERSLCRPRTSPFPFALSVYRCAGEGGNVYYSKHTDTPFVTDSSVSYYYREDGTQLCTTVGFGTGTCPGNESPFRGSCTVACTNEP